MMKKIAVILSGCGVFDGAEIHESTLLLLAIKRAGCSYTVFAPDKEQSEVINHCSGKQENEKRNILVEASRIARKGAQPLNRLNPENFDAIVLPGGFGVAKNLCDFAYKGENYTVIPEIESVLTKACKLKKPIGATCIAPILFAKIFKGSKITLGDVNEASIAAEKNGAFHVVTTHGETVVDEKYKLVTTPCYMLDADIVQIAEGTDNLITEILKLI
ncbi:MAG: isoprenoid biosynthesis glyoxalase ElbB [Prevotellaceae bacterium]|jgi:enhancing lycopene biosynthesis protein 2|nr:isoprenoid biosynthesis glyoxalase ElbB [Prevotellaceae bacterium]